VKYVIRPNAKDDILRQFRYYLLEDALDAATRFLEAVDESIEALCKMPEIGAPKQCKNPVLAGLRSWAVKDFEDVLIFYVVQPDALRVVRVLHGKRNLMKILEREKDDEKPN
jgi:plasmid stabilization system protein ParE